MKLITSSEHIDLYTEEYKPYEESGIKHFILKKLFPKYILQHTIEFEGRLKKTNDIVGSFQLVGMPNCCGLGISTDLFINYKYRSTPISKEFLELKERMPIYYDFPAIIATTQIDNIAEQKSMIKRGYKEIATWYNHKTDNELNIIFKDFNTN